jgi:hypothetical protein
MYLDFDRMLAFDSVSKNCLRLIQRNKEPFSDDKVRSKVGSRDGVRLISDATADILTPDRSCRRGRTKRNLVIAYELKGVSPNLQSTSGVPVDHGAASMCRDKTGGTYGIGIERKA